MILGDADFAVGQRLAQAGLLFLAQMAVGCPEALKRGNAHEIVRRQPVRLAARAAHIQIGQIFQLQQRRIISQMVIHEQLEEFQLLQVGQRRDIGDIIIAQNQQLHMREAAHEFQIFNGIMAQVERLKIFAVAQLLKVVLRVGVQRRAQFGTKGGDIGADDILALAHPEGPSEEDIRIAVKQQIHALLAEAAFVHVHFFKRGQLIDERLQLLHILILHIIAQIDDLVGRGESSAQRLHLIGKAHAVLVCFDHGQQLLIRGSHCDCSSGGQRVHEGGQLLRGKAGRVMQIDLRCLRRYSAAVVSVD